MRTNITAIFLGLATLTLTAGCGKCDYTLDAVWYHRGTARAFLIATPPRYAAPIDRRIAALLAGPWAAHFTREIA